MSAAVTIDPSFSGRIQLWAAAAGRTIPEAFRIQGRLLCNELMQRTPPFSGKSITRMLSAQGKMIKDPDVQQLSALRVGERRVEADIRKVIYGINGASKGKDSRQNYMDWGVLQRCQGKQAVRVFATKTGEVYGVDTSRFLANPSNEELGKHHKLNRTKRGRVTAAGSRTRDIGRWRWLDVIVTRERRLNGYIRAKKKEVGNAKGGWAAGYMRLGGRMSTHGWVGRHSDAGECRMSFGDYAADIEIINHSAWASSGDPDRVIANSMAGRDRAIAKDIERILKEKWGKS